MRLGVPVVASNDVRFVARGDYEAHEARVCIHDGTMLAEWGGYPEGWTFDPPESAFELQHYPGFSADGTLMASTHSLDTTKQWVREYEVDETNQVLRQIWSAETSHWAEYAGQAQKLPSGNVLWQLGTAGAVLELVRTYA